MKYLHQYSTQELISYSKYQKLKNLRGLMSHIDENYVSKSKSIKVESDSTASNGLRVVKYKAENGQDGATWYFSYSDKSNAQNKYYETYVVCGSALILEENRQIEIEQACDSREEAEKLYEKLIKKYPESEIILERRFTKSLKDYG